MWEAECDKYNFFYSPVKESAELAVGRSIFYVAWKIRRSNTFQAVNVLVFIVGTSRSLKMPSYSQLPEGQWILQCTLIKYLVEIAHCIVFDVRC